jgi:RNA processing factor Prp31
MTDADIANAGAILATAREGDALANLQREFYRAVLDEAEQIAMQTAEQMEGLDREIEVLRVKLRKIVKAKNPNLKLMIRGMDMLNRLVSTRYRISKRSQKDLAASIAAVLQSARSELGYGEDNGA